jgi:hypothetical protein
MQTFLCSHELKRQQKVTLNYVIVWKPISMKIRSICSSQAQIIAMWYPCLSYRQYLYMAEAYSQFLTSTLWAALLTYICKTDLLKLFWLGPQNLLLILLNWTKIKKKIITYSYFTSQCFRETHQIKCLNRFKFCKRFQ